jgi:Tol biopolymer transport system component
LASTTAKALAVTEAGAAYPFWSPDSRSIGYFSNGKLKRIDADGGSPQTIADARSGRGGTWNADGVILFSPTPAGPLFRIPATGGETVAATKLDWSGSHRFAQFLPDGNHFLFYVEGSKENPGAGAGAIYLGSLNSPEIKRLTEAESSGLFLPPNWLLCVHAGTLLAQRLNIAKGELSGDPVTVAESVFFDASHARLFSVSATGLVAYRRGNPTTQFTWFDRSGKALGTIAAPTDNDGSAPSAPRISPDGRRVAVSRAGQDRSNIWLLDETHAVRFTFLEAGWSGNCIWSHDGSKILFKAIRKGQVRFYVKPSDGTGSESLVADVGSMDDQMDDWSPDGRFLIYESQDTNSATGYDLFAMPLDGDRKPWTFLQTRFDEKQARFSPDGRWVAYQSNESGRPEVYIRPFVELAAGVRTDTASPQWQVSVDGGLFPTWSHDGKELYWVGPGSRMMAATITVTGKTLQTSPPVALFQTRVFGGGLDINTGGRQFDVASDGRFLVNTILDTASTPITLLQNWKPK